MPTRSHCDWHLLFITHWTRYFQFGKCLHYSLQCDIWILACTQFTKKKSTLHWGHLLALWAQVLHIMAWPHGSNLTSTGDSHKKQASWLEPPGAAISIEITRHITMNDQLWTTVHVNNYYQSLLTVVFRLTVESVSLQPVGVKLD